MRIRNLVFIAVVFVVFVYFSSYALLENTLIKSKPVKRRQHRVQDNDEDDKQEQKSQDHDDTHEQEEFVTRRRRRRKRRKPVRKVSSKPIATNAPSPVTYTPPGVSYRPVKQQGQEISKKKKNVHLVRFPPSFSGLRVIQSMTTVYQRIEDTSMIHLKSPLAQFHLEPPNTVPGNDHSFHPEQHSRFPKTPTQFKWPPHDTMRYLVEFHHGWIHPSSLIYDNEYIFNIGWDGKQDADIQDVLRFPNRTLNYENCVHFPEMLSLSSPGSCDYTNWYTKTLPRLFQVFNFVREHPNIALLIDEPNHGWVKNSIKRLGLWDRVIEKQPNTAYHASTLYYARPEWDIAPAQEHIEEIYGRLAMPFFSARQTIVCIQQNPDGSSPYGDDAIGVRFCSLIRSALQKHTQYEVVNYKGMQEYEPTVKLFSNARMIVGAQSPAFVHLVFSRPKTVILELTVKKHRSLLTYNMSQARGMDYWIVEEGHCDTTPCKFDLVHLHKDLSTIMDTIVASRL